MSNLIRWDPFERSISIPQTINDLFDGNLLWGWPNDRNGVRSLALDMRETDEALVVEASLPGIKPEDVDISISGNALTIKGESKQEKEEEQEKYHYRERRYGIYQRTITLPVEVDADGADATFQDGVLKLTLPKMEETKAKHIEVKI
jgi:HSP20 family protein